MGFGCGGFDGLCETCQRCLDGIHCGRDILTAAIQILEIAVPSLSSLLHSIASPTFRTLIPTFPIAYAVFPQKNRL